MKKLVKTSLALALLSSIGFIGVAQAQKDAQPTKSIPARQAPSQALQAATPAAAPAAATPASSTIRGLIVADREALLSSPMAGRLGSFYIKPGQKFYRGQTILRFECGEQYAKSAMAEAELDSAEETQQAKMRMQGLAQASELEVKLASANVARAQANLHLQHIGTKNCTLVAPFNGKVSKINAKPYQGVQIGQPLIEFISDKNLNVKVNAPAKMATKLKVGDTISIQVDETEKSYKAKIIAINAKIDAVSQTFELEAKITDDAGALVAGMSGNVSF